MVRLGKRRINAPNFKVYGSGCDQRALFNRILGHPFRLKRRTMTTEELAKMANTIRQDIIKMLVEAGSGHSAGPLPGLPGNC